MAKNKKHMGYHGHHDSCEITLYSDDRYPCTCPKGPVKTVIYEAFGCIYTETKGNFRFCARKGCWISTPSIPSFAKRLCVINNFKER